MDKHDRQYMNNMMQNLREHKELFPSGLIMQRWSPGDGWTRYKLTNLEGSRDYSQNLKIGEMLEFLRGTQMILRQQEDIKNTKIYQVVA